MVGVVYVSCVILLRLDADAHKVLRSYLSDTRHVRTLTSRVLLHVYMLVHFRSACTSGRDTLTKAPLLLLCSTTGCGCGGVTPSTRRR